jgi:predicted RNA-binding Zn-ribbon protein involved in translation (DUF1610 family)
MSQWTSSAERLSDGVHVRSETSRSGWQVTLTCVEHQKDGVRLILATADTDAGEVVLCVGTSRAEELARALYLGGSAYGVPAISSEGAPATLDVANDAITLELDGREPDLFFAFAPDDARALGATIPARPVSSEVECPACGEHSWKESTLAPPGDIAKARARSECWTCPHCGHQVVSADLVGYSDDVWRIPPDA